MAENKEKPQPSMSDKELCNYLQIVTAELNRRAEVKHAVFKFDPEPSTLCDDLFATAEAVRQALIDNNCEPL